MTVIFLRRFFVLGVMLASFSFSPILQAKKDEVPQTLPGGWKLVWNDEFDGSKLDREKWEPEIGNVRNQNAKQVYTDSTKNLRLKKGMLEIEARHDPNTPCPTYNPDAPQQNWITQRKTCDYTSASLTTRKTYPFLFGRLEMRAKVPAGKGVWPAIWTMGQNQWGWPANAEIDILEHISNEPETIYAIFRWGNPPGNDERKVVRTVRIPQLANDFHLYVLEWDEQVMRVLIDDKEIGRVNISEANYANGENPLRTPHYLIINLALGGWAEAPDPKAYPVKYMLDYVRHYQKDEHLSAIEKLNPKNGAYKE